MENQFDWSKAFSVDFDLETGRSATAESTKRNLSRMKGMFADDAALNRILSNDDPLVYEFYELGAPQENAHLLFGTSILYPGKVGEEYFMTKGHFHTILETSEVYYCLSGSGFLLMESPAGDWLIKKMEPGKATYVPPCYAHRTINTGGVPMVSFFVFRADAGHDYGAIETKGYRKLLVERDGEPVIIDNPKWK